MYSSTVLMMLIGFYEFMNRKIMREEVIFLASYIFYLFVTHFFVIHFVIFFVIHFFEHRILQKRVGVCGDFFLAKN